MKKTIRLNKNVEEYLKNNSYDIDYIVDASIYYAEQHATSAARRAGMEFEEIAVKASLRLASLIGDVTITAQYFGGETYTLRGTDYFYLA